MKNSIRLIEKILNNYRNELGKDFEKYSNHVHRVFALCLELDTLENNIEKYAIAAVFHDLGIWTNNSFDYLEPSILLVNRYLNISGKSDLINEIEIMIDMHHKRTSYKGDYETTVEVFRRADWIDVTKGRILFGLPKTTYIKILNLYPTLGFHKFLIIEAIKYFLKSPLNPLPMFKK